MYHKAYTIKTIIISACLGMNLPIYATDLENPEKQQPSSVITLPTEQASSETNNSAASITTNVNHEAEISVNHTQEPTITQEEHTNLPVSNHTASKEKVNEPKLKDPANPLNQTWLDHIKNFFTNLTKTTK